MITIRNTLILASLAVLATAEYPRAGSKCVVDTDCYEEYEQCNSKSICEHKTLFPLRPLEIGGFVVYTVTAFFSNFSGIAGALPLIAIIAMQKFNMKSGIMLSNAQICSAGIARLAMDGNKTHPLRKTHGILLDFSMLTMMLPMITLGSALAVVV
jgi:hypothetical protein